MTRIADYDFDLPAELVAQHPLQNRSDARVMVIDRESGGIELNGRNGRSGAKNGGSDPTSRTHQGPE